MKTFTVKDRNAVLHEVDAARAFAAEHKLHCIVDVSSDIIDDETVFVNLAYFDSHFQALNYGAELATNHRNIEDYHPDSYSWAVYFDCNYKCSEHDFKWEDQNEESQI